jgi:hypothetical protein
MTKILPLMLVAALGVAQPARAVEVTVQKPGNPQVWPGKFMIGFHPIGFQAAFDEFSTGGYKLSIDLAYRVKEWSKISLWFGGDLSYALPLYTCNDNFSHPGHMEGCAHDLGFMLFVRLTFEKLLTKLPLVPYVDVGLGADMLVFAGSPHSNAGTNIGAGIPLRIGVGMHYWVLKYLGVGFETHFAFGPGVYPSVGQQIDRFCPPNNTCTEFFGYWDFLLGVRAAF